MQRTSCSIALLAFCVVLAIGTDRPLARDVGGVRVRVLDRSGAPVYAAAVTLVPRSGDFDPRRLLTDAAGIADFGTSSLGGPHLVKVDTLAGRHGPAEAFVPAGWSGIIDVRVGVDSAQMPRPFLAGTALPSPGLMGYRPARHEPLLEAPAAPPHRSGDDLDATLGIRFGSSLLDGSRAGADSPLGEPAFETLAPWVRISGALAGGRAWYRLSQDVVRDERPIGVGGGLLVQTHRQASLAPRVAWQVSPRNRVALEYRRQSLEIDRFGVSSTVGSVASPTIDADMDALELRWVAPVSATLQIEGSVEWRDAAERVVPTAPGRPNDCVAPSAEDFLTEALCRSLGTQRSSGSYYLNADAATESLTARSLITLREVRLWGAAHTLKAGFTVRNERLSRSSLGGPRVEHQVLRPIRDPDSAAVYEDLHLLSATVDLRSSAAAEVRGVDWGLYAEDRFRLRANLALTLGALLERSERSGEGFAPFDPRAERARFFELLAEGKTPEQIFAAGNFTAYEGRDHLAQDLEDATGIRFTSQQAEILNLPPTPWPRRRSRAGLELSDTNLSPYLTLDWTPWANGKSRVTLAARRGHDAIPLQVLALEQQPTTWNLQFGAEPVLGRAVPVSILIGPAGSARTVSPGLRPATHLEYVLALERELSASTRVRAQWVERRYRDQFRGHDINQAPGDFGRCRVQQPSTGFDPLVASPGSGFEIVDPVTGQTYVDTDPGVGDGRVDDCRGLTFVLPSFYSPGNGVFGAPYERPDGRPDLYKQNPGWGSVITVDNSGRSDYEALVLELIRRERGGWQLQGNYTWSRHRGNYERLATFDELDPTLSDDGIHDQPDDRRHAVQVEAATGIGRFRLAGRATWESGLPFSLLQQSLSYDVIPPAFRLAPEYGQYGIASPRNRVEYSGDRNGARNSGRTLFDVLATRAFGPRAGGSIEVAVAVENLLDDRSYRVANPDYGAGFRINGIDSARREFGRRLQLSLTAQW